MTNTGFLDLEGRRFLVVGLFVWVAGVAAGLAALLEPEEVLAGALLVVFFEVFFAVFFVAFEVEAFEGAVDFLVVFFETFLFAAAFFVVFFADAFLVDFLATFFLVTFFLVTFFAAAFFATFFEDLAVGFLAVFLTVFFVTFFAAAFFEVRVDVRDAPLEAVFLVVFFFDTFFLAKRVPSRRKRRRSSQDLLFGHKVRRTDRSGQSEDRIQPKLRGFRPLRGLRPVWARQVRHSRPVS